MDVVQILALWLLKQRSSTTPLGVKMKYMDIHNNLGKLK